MMKCVNCAWEGEDQPLGYGGFPHCPVCGQSIREYEKVGKKEVPVEEVKIEEPKIDLDLNNDGKVDKKDRSLAAKFLGSRKGKTSKRK